MSIRIIAISAAVTLVAGCSDSPGPHDSAGGSPLGNLEFPTVVTPQFPLRNVIAYATNRYSVSDVFLISTDGASRKRLTDDGSSSCPAVSPAGNEIALLNAAGLTFIRESGKVTTQGERGCAVWSPDGSKVLTTVFKTLTVYSSAGQEIAHLTLDDLIPTAAWTPDGNSVVFTTCFLVKGPCADNRLNVIPVSSLTSQSMRLLIRGGAAPAVSPDGGTVAFNCSSNLDHVCAIPIAGGASSDFGEGTDPAWSPVDQTFAYKCNEFVCVANSGTGTTRQLPVKATSFRWAPDGKAFAVTWGRRNNDVHLVNADGTNLRNLTADRSIDALGTWSTINPGGSTLPIVPGPSGWHGTKSLASGDIIYQSTKSSTSLDAVEPMRVVDSKGLPNRRLLRSQLGESCPAVSPDRKAVAFESLGIWIAAVDGSGETQISDSLRLMMYACPIWSPDQRYLAFVTGTGLDMHLWISSTDTPAPKELTAAPDIRDVVWMADSQSLLYRAESSFQSSVNRIHQITLNGSKKDFGPVEWKAPSVSSTGNVAIGCGTQICVVGLSGENSRTLAEGWAPLWSPDGNKILFRRGDYDIFVMDADGTNVKNVLSPQFYVKWISWSPDGKAFASEGNANVNVANLDGSFLKQITTEVWAVRPSWTEPRIPELVSR